MQALFVVSGFQNTQSTQPNLTEQPNHSLSYFVGFFLTFVFIGFVLGWFIQYLKYQKLRKQRRAVIFQEIETLDRIQKMTHVIDDTVSTQRKKQIETLEKIWKMKP